MISPDDSTISNRRSSSFAVAGTERSREAVAMLYVDDERCSGCGVCVDVCPSGAISLHDGKASISQHLCNQCEACASACPQGAILSVSETTLVPETSHVQALQPKRPLGGTSITARMAPAVGAALLFIGREVVPRVADYVLDTVDRKMKRQPDGRADATQAPVDTGPGGRSGGRRRRRHHGS
jgi:ferredoxin